VFDALSELALLTAIEQWWVESHVPFPTGPVTMCIVQCPLPVGSGWRRPALAKVQPAELPVEMSTWEHSRMLTTLPAVYPLHVTVTASPLVDLGQETPTLADGLPAPQGLQSLLRATLA
jgi:hypothetical protein